MTDFEKMKAVYDRLDKLNIKYEVTEHEPVYTIEEMEMLGICRQGCVCKNLFLRNANGRQHYLVVLRNDKKADLKALQGILGCSKMGFASEERLARYLNLTKGAVTPFGLIFDSEKAVNVVIDEDLIGNERLGFHPAVNTATVWISFDDLKKLLRDCDSNVVYVRI